MGGLRTQRLCVVAPLQIALGRGDVERTAAHELDVRCVLAKGFDVLVVDGRGDAGAAFEEAHALQHLCKVLARLRLVHVLQLDVVGRAGLHVRDGAGNGQHAVLCVEEADGVGDDPEGWRGVLDEDAFGGFEDGFYGAVGFGRVQRLEDGGDGFVEVLLAAFGVVGAGGVLDEVAEGGLVLVILGHVAVVRGFPFLEVVQEQGDVGYVAVVIGGHGVYVLGLRLCVFEEFGPGLEEAEVGGGFGAGVGVYNGEGGREVNGEVGVEADGVDVEEWDERLVCVGGELGE